MALFFFISIKRLAAECISGIAVAACSHEPQLGRVLIWFRGSRSSRYDRQCNGAQHRRRSGPLHYTCGYYYYYNSTQWYCALERRVCSRQCNGKITSIWITTWPIRFYFSASAGALCLHGHAAGRSTRQLPILCRCRMPSAKLPPINKVCNQFRRCSAWSNWLRACFWAIRYTGGRHGSVKPKCAEI